jgi:hypothetical protein
MNFHLFVVRLARNETVTLLDEILRHITDLAKLIWRMARCGPEVGLAASFGADEVFIAW